MHPGTMVYDYPSVEEAAKFLHGSLVPTVITAEAVTRFSQPLISDTCTDGHVVKMYTASRLPESQPLLRGAAGPVTAAVRCPGDIVGSVPWGRWDLDSARASGKLPRVRFGAWLGNVEAFDAGLFGISGQEAQLMDPQQRILLEVSHEALQVRVPSRCNLDNPALVCCCCGESEYWRCAHTAQESSVCVGLQGGSGGKAGEGTAVYVGIQQMEYGSLAAAHLADMGAFTATGSPFSVAAGRLSFTYGFKGPSVSPMSLCHPAPWTCIMPDCSVLEVDK